MSAWKSTVETLLRERGPALFGYAYVLTGSSHAADDLLQDALVRSFSHGKAGYSLNQSHDYVKRVMLSVFIDGYRKAKSRRTDVDADIDAPIEDHAEGVTSAVALHHAILSLPPRERACVVLRFLDDLPIAGVARELGLAQGSVKRYLHDATTRLRTTHPDLKELHTTSSQEASTVRITHKESRR